MSIESDPWSELERTKELLQEHKLNLRIKKLNRCKKVGVMNYADKADPILHTNNYAKDSELVEDDNDLGELGPKQSLERLNKFGERPRSKVWSLNQTIHNLNDENNELSSNLKSKAQMTIQKNLRLEIVSNGYAVEFLPATLVAQTHEAIVRVDKIIQTSWPSFTIPDGKHNSIA